jgi:hypothetical protein
MLRRARHALLVLMALPLLTNCLLMSGAQQSTDRADDAGNVNVQFVSADGTEVREVPVADGATSLLVTVFAHVDRGQLRIEVLDPNNSAVIILEGTPEEQVARGTVPTDTAGNLRFRIKATGAHRGGFQILYQPASA